MKQYRQEYLEALESLDGDVPGCEAALSYIEQSDIWVHGRPVPFSYVPNLVGSQDRRFLQEVCTMAHTILCKVIARYLEDATYRALFGFSPEMERLIMLPCDYGQMLPLARFDIFLDENDLSFKFCEFNTDGSGAMSRDLEIGHALQRGATYHQFASRHRVEQFELFDSWVEAFMSSYRECPYAKPCPTVAVTDFRESGVFSDFNRFIAAFERAGYPARFVDVRSFIFDGENLVDPSDGTVIDVIYRRAVTSEMLQHPGECDALIDAVEQRKVCLIGHFRTTVVHSKVVSIVLFDSQTRSFLTDEECSFIDEHVPRTFRLQRGQGFDVNVVKASKDAWIIKPEDDYGARGVYPGVSMAADEWGALVDQKLDESYIVQEYYPPREVGLVRADVSEVGGQSAVEAWTSMPGLYVYNGAFKGLYCRNGCEGIIALDHGGLCSPSFSVDDENF
ncbi:MAG: hypothetical protein RRZ85_08555 [Gordonibacter sp.]